MSQVTRKVIADSIRNNDIRSVRSRWQWREMLGDYYPLVKPYLREVGGILYEYRNEPWGALHEVRQWGGSLKIAYSTAESPDDWGDISEDECKLCELEDDAILKLRELSGVLDAGPNDNIEKLPAYVITNKKGEEFSVSSDFAVVTKLRNGKPVMDSEHLLRPLATAYLSTLVENCGRVVTRDELIESAKNRYKIIKKPLPSTLAIYDVFRVSRTEGKKQLGIYSAFKIKGGWDSNSTYLLPLSRLRRR